MLNATTNATMDATSARIDSWILFGVTHAEVFEIWNFQIEAPVASITLVPDGDGGVVGQIDEWTVKVTPGAHSRSKYMAGEITYASTRLPPQSPLNPPLISPPLDSQP